MSYAETVPAFDHSAVTWLAKTWNVGEAWTMAFIETTQRFFTKPFIAILDAFTHDNDKRMKIQARRAYVGNLDTGASRPSFLSQAMFRLRDSFLPKLTKS